MKTRLAVAVSGGMDSLLALALALEEGFDAFALHARFLPPDGNTARLEEELAAQCARLGVPLHTADLSEDFERRVISPFIEEYVSGRTPNPCALCNREMKFSLLFNAARKLGAESIATGHYARLGDHPAYGPCLMRGKDAAKEQSYFLCLTRREDVLRAVFPLGELCKAEVPDMLQNRGLTPPLKAESQEVCFVPDDDYKTYLLSRRADLPGPGVIALEDGRELGEHQGLWRYTTGQRRGLGIAHSTPLYVLEKDTAQNRLIVGPASSLRVEGFEGIRPNVLVDPALWPAEVLVKTRYRQQAERAEARLSDGKLEVRFASPSERPAPGQAACCYSPDGAALCGATVADSTLLAKATP